jgi:hypothetical protein
MRGLPTVLEYTPNPGAPKAVLVMTKFGPERQAVFFGERELLAEIHVPVLFKGSANNTPAQVAEEAATGGADCEGLIARATIDVESGDHGAPGQFWRGRQGAGVEYSGATGEILWTPAEHQAARAGHEIG